MEHKKEEPRTKSDRSDSFESFRNYSKVSKNKPLSNLNVSCLEMRPRRKELTKENRNKKLEKKVR